MNKEAEYFYLSKFKENFEDFPSGEICRHERPDFLVRNSRGDLGIEITDFYRQMSSETGLPLQQRENVRHKIITIAKDIYDARGQPSAFVAVHFDLNFHCRQSEIRSIAERLAQLAESSLSGAVEEKVWRIYEIQLNGISLLTVKKMALPKSYWSAPLASFVPTASPKQIQDILDKKSARCDAYKERCKIIWLVIVIDRFKASSFSIITNDVVEHSYKHGFDSAFLFFYDRDDLQKPPMLLRNG